MINNSLSGFIRNMGERDMLTTSEREYRDNLYGLITDMNLKTKEQQLLERQKQGKKNSFINAVQENNFKMVDSLAEELFTCRTSERIEIVLRALGYALSTQSINVNMVCKLVFLLKGDELRTIPQEKQSLLLKTWRLAMQFSRFETLEHLWVSGKVCPPLRDPLNMDPAIAPDFLKYMESVNVFPVWNDEASQLYKALYNGLQAVVAEAIQMKKLQAGWVLVASTPASPPLEEGVLGNHHSSAYPLKTEVTGAQPLTSLYHAKIKPNTSCSQQHWQVAQTEHLKRINRSAIPVISRRNKMGNF
jgi:hypothetical protein